MVVVLNDDVMIMINEIDFVDDDDDVMNVNELYFVEKISDHHNNHFENDFHDPINSIEN